MPNEHLDCILNIHYKLPFVKAVCVYDKQNGLIIIISFISINKDVYKITVFLCADNI